MFIFSFVTSNIRITCNQEFRKKCRALISGNIFVYLNVPFSRKWCFIRSYSPITVYIVFLYELLRRTLSFLWLATWLVVFLAASLNRQWVNNISAHPSLILRISFFQQTDWPRMLENCCRLPACLLASIGKHSKSFILSITSSKI